jgi:polyhydroxyalkanoate synthase
LAKERTVVRSVEGAEELAAPLDLLLTSALGGTAERLRPNASWSRLGLNLARRPRTVTSRVGRLGLELVSIARGSSDVAAAKSDKRFADEAWLRNPMLKRLMQAYLAASETVNELYSDADLDWRDGERMRFVLDVLTEGLAPSNSPLISPLGWKALIDTGGLSAVRGLRNFVGTWLRRRGCPQLWSQAPSRWVRRSPLPLGQ